MTAITSINTEQMAARIRRILEGQRADLDLEPWEAESLREMINLAWHLERRLEVWEDYRALQKERGGE